VVIWCTWDRGSFSAATFVAWVRGADVRDYDVLVRQ
jgi:hypothetical protein